MGEELKIYKDLAVVSVTAVELADIVTAIKGHISRSEFVERLDSITKNIVKSYDVVLTNLQPFLEIKTQQVFDEAFATKLEQYRDRYLLEVSYPRKYTDDAYLDYLELCQLKETKTSFPLLRYHFDRLDVLIDKWMTNDAWLSMYIDSAFKLLNRFLSQVEEMRSKDAEAAFFLFDHTMRGIEGYLSMLIVMKARLQAL